MRKSHRLARWLIATVAIFSALIYLFAWSNVFTVKEIRDQIAVDIEGTSELWKAKGLNKSRRTQKAFDISAAIARGQNEVQVEKP